MIPEYSTTIKYIVFFVGYWWGVISRAVESVEYSHIAIASSSLLSWKNSTY